MLNIGIIGFGKMGQVRAESFEAIKGCKVTSVFDINVPRITKYHIADSADTIISDPNIDAVVVCVPNFLIKSTVLNALQAGKHVFCEKPPAMNLKDMEEIASSWEKSSSVLMYGFNHRRHSAVIKMKKLVDKGDLGRILWMRGRYGKSVDSDYLSGWRASKIQAGGGILLDQGIHMLDLFLHIGGQTFDEVHAMVSNLYWQTEGIEDNVFAVLRNTQSGMCAQLHSTMTQWRHLFSLEIFLEKGYMVLNGLKTNSGTYGDEILTIARNRSKAPAATWKEEERLEFTHNSSWMIEAKEFVAAVKNPQRRTHGTVCDALEVMKLIDTIYANDTFISPSRHSDLI